MKILHAVEYYYPSIGGAQEVVRQISERLVKLGHDVTVATTKLPDRKSTVHNGVKIAEFDVSGKGALGYSGTDIQNYKDFLINSDFDVVMNYAAQQWATDLAIEVLDKISARKILVPCGFSGLYDPKFKDYFEKMPNTMRQYDATVYLSDDYRDINFARKHKIKNTFLIPNGAGADEFSQAIDLSIRTNLNIPNDNLLILSVGSHTGLKGHAEAIRIFEQANIQNSTLLIVANDFGIGCSTQCKRRAQLSKLLPSYRRRHKQLIVKDLPRPETVAAYKSADLFLFPSNIEASPLVLFEAMASQLPFLTTDVGNAEEIIKWSHGGALLPTDKDADGYSHARIRESARLLEKWVDAPAIKKIGETGHKAWQKSFTWEKITKQYEKLYKGTRP